MVGVTYEANKALETFVEPEAHEARELGDARENP